MMRRRADIGTNNRPVTLAVMARLGCVVAALLLLAVAAESAKLVGGLSDASLDDPAVKEALGFAVHEYNMRSNDIYESRVVKLHQAQKQVVSGIMYKLDVELGRTNCRKPSLYHEKCEFHSNGELAEKKRCKFSVISRPWKPETRLEKSDCN
ncbi:cystatin-2-like [Hyperolius riggenbachi]|uniref:cystatin-2-like n=1 Tax=Hyperolius riggenbachi TaxID=752182 RepID=UPI0035A2CFE5